MILKSAMCLSHIVASTSAIIRSVEYGRVLGIKGKEWNRYLKKSISFGLCYAGFGIPGRMQEAWAAGEAAFLCCAYDVVTDWRHFDPEARSIYERILHTRVPQSELQVLVMELYEKECLSLLTEDGLERGSIALRFTLKMMGAEKAREIEWGNIDELGRLLQIVDDVLDYEEDIISGDQNCLASIRRNVYLRELLAKLNPRESRKLFGDRRSVLVAVIEQAGKKAEQLLGLDGQTFRSVRKHEAHDGLS